MLSKNASRIDELLQFKRHPHAFTFNISWGLEIELFLLYVTEPHECEKYLWSQKEFLHVGDSHNMFLVCHVLLLRLLLCLKLGTVKNFQ